jgi:hypothetical protein
MMIRVIGMALLLGIGSGMPVQGPTKHRKAEAKIIWDGNQLFDLCLHFKKERLTGSLGPSCLMYVTGIAQTLLMNDDSDHMASPCPGDGVTNEQITDVVIKWLEDHPARREAPAPFIVMTALNEAFPCR